MAGWLYARALNGCPLPTELWTRALTTGAGDESTESAQPIPTVQIAAWRRPRGEFPHSGRITVQRDITRAWVGQCLSDTGDDTESALALLAGDAPAHEAVARLNGPFAAVVLNPNTQRATIWTDRHGHYPVYIYRDDAISVASTSFAALQALLPKPALHEAALDLLLAAGELVDRHTLLQGVELLPGGLAREDDDTAAHESRYWRFEFAPDASLAFDDCADTIGSALRTAVHRIENANSSLGCPLSGGLDSRFILGLARNPQRIPSFTWGPRRCRDQRFASQFARRIGSPHHPREWPLDDFPPRWHMGVERIAGACGVHEMFMLPFTELLAEHCDVTLNGLAGDVLLGGNAVRGDWLRAAPVETVTHSLWTWRVAAADLKRLKMLRPHAIDPQAMWRRSLRSAAHGAALLTPAQIQSWILHNRIFRFTNCGTMLLRGAVESHAPFYDRDVMDFMLRIPLRYRFKHKLYLAALNRACEAAAAVPWQRTLLPPRFGHAAALGALAYHRLGRMAGRLIGWDPFPSAAVAHVADWFRGAWRAPTEELLLSDRTLARPWLDADGVRRLWSEHQDGANCARQLGVLVSIEHFARSFLDNVAAAPLESARATD